MRKPSKRSFIYSQAPANTNEIEPINLSQARMIGFFRGLDIHVQPINTQTESDVFLRETLAGHLGTLDSSALLQESCP